METKGPACSVASGTLHQRTTNAGGGMEGGGHAVPSGVGRHSCGSGFTRHATSAAAGEAASEARAFSKRSLEKQNPKY